MNYLDTETFSAVPIKHGTYRYTQSCECMVVTYALGRTAPVRVWDVTAGEQMPEDLAYILDDPDEIISAHFAMFDRNVLRYALGRDIPIRRWRCTMTRAMWHGLPGSLDILGTIFKLPEDKAKLKTGRRLIHLFCKPQPKTAKIARANRETHPAEWAQFLEYAKGDIEAMRAVDAKLPTWNDAELDAYHLDQKINDRGICVDVGFAEAAIRAVEREQRRLAADVHRRTAGAVQSATKRDQLLAHILTAYGIDLPDLQMATLERRINDADLPVELRELLALRLQASTTSTSKYKALVRSVSDDGRLRGTLQFSGAQRTRRWAGRIFQPQNLARLDLEVIAGELRCSVKEAEARALEYLTDGIAAINADVADLFYDNVMALAANAVRGTIIASPGRKLVIADLSNIEGRDAAWLAGENWKLAAFADFDRGIGADLYKVAYSKAFKIAPADVGKDQRQIGKVMELMLQYEGGVGAFITGAATYKIDLEAMADAAIESIPDNVMDEAVGMWEWTLKSKRSTFGLSQRVFTVCDALKRLWRYAHPEIVGTWADLRENCQQAIWSPGKAFAFRRFVAVREGNWLLLKLPSGRCLCYPSPRVADDGAISYMGMNQYTKTWSRIGTYGGKLFENACQAVAGDVLKHAMPAMEAAGYEIVLTVHDEAVTEAPDTPEYSAKALAGILATVPKWADGLPLAAAGFETDRYRKD